MRIEEGLTHKGFPYYIPDCSRDDLPQFFVDRGFKVGAEIGVSMGSYSMQLLEAGLKVYGVDPYLSYPDHIYRPLNTWKRKGYNVETMEDVYNYAMSTCGANPNYTMIRKTSMDALEDIPGASLDFVYIDANHLYGYVAMDLMQWAGKVKKGGFIAGHDYFHPYGSLSCRGIAPAVDGFCRSAFVENFWVLGSKRTLKRGEKVRDERLDDHLSFLIQRHW